MYYSIKKKKIIKNTINQEGKRFVHWKLRDYRKKKLKKTSCRNLSWRLKELILLTWQQHPKWLTDSMQLQQNTNAVGISCFCRNRKIYFNIYMESEGTLNSQNQNHLDKEEQSWKSHTLWFHSLWQICSNQNGGVLA